MRREVADRIVAPVVAQPFLLQEVVVDEVVDRQQFHRGHAKLLEIVDGKLGADGRVGAAELLGNIRAKLGEAFHMSLVNHRAMQRRRELAVAAPVEVIVHDHAFRHPESIVALVDGEVGILRAAGLVAKHFFAPLHLACDGLGIGVDEQLCRVEAMALIGFIRPVNAIPVVLARLQTGQEAMPDLVRVLGHADPHGLMRRIGAVEEAQVHAGGIFREQREVHAFVHHCGPEWIWQALPDLRLRHRIP